MDFVIVQPVVAQRSSDAAEAEEAAVIAPEDQRKRARNRQIGRGALKLLARPGGEWIAAQALRGGCVPPDWIGLYIRSRGHLRRAVERIGEGDGDRLLVLVDGHLRLKGS